MDRRAVTSKPAGLRRFATVALSMMAASGAVAAGCSPGSAGDEGSEAARSSGNLALVAPSAVGGEDPIATTSTTATTAGRETDGSSSPEPTPSPAAVHTVTGPGHGQPDDQAATISLGTVDNPFVELPVSPEARAVITPAGIVLPVVDERPTSWLVSTPCQNIRFVTDAQPIGRAHVVLDAGHGGDEVGAVGSTGLREKDLNLLVAVKAAELLRQAGATVVLTRSSDHSITAAARGHIARAIDPALFVSIHHNGGAPPGGRRPGTIVFTKAENEPSTRFGGLLHQTMQPMLDGAAEQARNNYAVYAELMDGYDAELATYDRLMAERDAILVGNGQVPADATTTMPTTTSTVEPGRLRVPATRPTVSSTTVAPAATADGSPPIAVPPLPAAPTPPDGDPRGPFSWAGSGNAGVRAWTNDDGQDYLGVLRNSGSVPAVLAEFPYLTNPSEELLLLDPAFIDREAGVLVDAIVLFFTTRASGNGHVSDQHGSQPIGGGGGISSCREPEL